MSQIFKVCYLNKDEIKKIFVFIGNKQLTDGTTIDGTNTLESSEINQITLNSAHLGFTKWFFVGAANQIASATNFNLGLNPSSGSGGA